MRCRHHIGIHSSLAVELAPNVLQERCHRLLDGLNNVCLELLKRVLHRNKIFAVVVLFQYLFTETMIDSSLEYVRIIGRIDLTSRTCERSSMLAKKLNVFLGDVPSLVDALGTFHRTPRELFGLVLDLSVEAFQDREDGSLDVFLSLEMRVGDALRIGPDILEKASNSTQALVKVLALFQRMGYCLRALSAWPFMSRTT